MRPHLVCVGGEDHALRIPFLLALRDMGFQVTAVSSCDGRAFASHHLPHHRYAFDRFSTFGGTSGAVRHLGGLMRELRPDLVQSFDTKPNLLVPLSIRGSVPVIRTINGLGWVFSSTEARARLLRPVFCGMQRLVGRWSATTVFQNREDEQFFARHRLLGPGKSRLIGSSGIDVEGFLSARKSGPSPDELRRLLGLESAEIVLFVGRLTRQKGIPTLLKAVPEVLARRPSARFVLVGPHDSEGPFSIDPAALDQLRPHVVALGRRSDVPALLGMADVFAFPTEYREGIPRVLLEAGLAGLPIVATQMPGCNDVVSDSVNGYLVAPRDADGLADRIVALLEDPSAARRMGERSIALVRERYDLTRVVGQYRDLYREVLTSVTTGSPASAGEPLRADERTGRTLHAGSP
jgi:glycosyltransferase involved in cell wall biosynthesis